MAISFSVVNRLAQVSIFQGLGPAELEELALLCTRKKFTQDSKFVFSEGEENCFCIINSGKVIVKTIDSSGQGKILTILEPGDFFGEINAIDSESKDYDLFAHEKDVEVLLFTQKDFTDLLQNYPSVHLALSREFCRRLRITNHKYSKICLPSKIRVALIILSIANKQGVLVNEGIVLPPLSQNEVAKLADSSKEVLIAIFNELKNEALIKATENRQVLIPNKQKLEEWIHKNSSN